MKNMTLSADEAKEYGGLCCSDDDNGPKYPYGLSINLDKATMKKLGMTGLAEVGTKMNLMAVVMVTSVGQHQRQGGEVSADMCLQITEMDLQQPQTDTDIANKMWSSDKK